MRSITDHETNACNRAIKIVADDVDAANGNASHKYEVEYPAGAASTEVQWVRFQHGPIGEVGVNGTTNEALLAIVIDRLRCFQTSKYACQHNADALAGCEVALKAMGARTAEREGRGVEGTHTV